MKVGELIKELEQYDKKANIYSNGQHITAVDCGTLYNKDGAIKDKRAVIIFHLTDVFKNP